MPAPLHPQLPAPGQTLTSDEVLDRFISWVGETGLTLYPAQEEALLELSSGKHLVLATPTGSGKSLVATFLHFKALCEGKPSFYTCPIKALVNEKFFALCEAFGPERVGMVTGDASINAEAKIICCTAEVLANLALREGALSADYVVMDEFHYYGDRERGTAWQIPLLCLPSTTFLLMSATLGDTKNIEDSLAALTRRDVAQVKSAQRPVPLTFDYKEIPLHETLQELITKNRAPVYLVNFSQRSAAEEVQNLTSVNFCSKEEKEQLREAMQGARFDTPYGKDVQKYLRHGLGLHHAGLLPKYRLLVEKLAQKGLLKVVSGTDTLGVGVNIPLRTVLFTRLFKFDGDKLGVLSVRDFLQIAGRAGRKGFDDEGFVVAQAPEHVVENVKLSAKEAQGKKVVKQKPPQKGYVHYDRQTFERLINGIPDPLESRFQVSHGLLLNLLQSDDAGYGGGYGRLVRLIDRSHGRPYDKLKSLKLAATLARTLRTAGLVDLQRGRPAKLSVKAGLQHDFSLNHTLSLWLWETLPKLDQESEFWALDVLTLVESILEDPDPVLYAQLNKLKGEKVAELKAQGMEFDQRMEELDKLEYPKPHRDFIYATFNDFARRHPWVGQENIRPKSIAREMMETFSTFHEYVRDYGLQRFEGVSLRYLSQVYKALAQTVPVDLRTEQVEDILAMLRTTLRTVDSSLLEEWEGLRGLPAEQRPLARALKKEAPDDWLANPKRFAIQVRSELHALVKALAAKDFDLAVACLYQPDGGWTPEKLEQELAPYFEEYPSLDVTPKARANNLTLLKEVGPRRFDAQQRLLDPEGHADWMLDCKVDLTEARPLDQPLIALRRIGR